MSGLAIGAGMRAEAEAGSGRAGTSSAAGAAASGPSLGSGSALRRSFQRPRLSSRTSSAAPPSSGQLVEPDDSVVVAAAIGAGRGRAVSLGAGSADGAAVGVGAGFAVVAGWLGAAWGPVGADIGAAVGRAVGLGAGAVAEAAGDGEGAGGVLASGRGVEMTIGLSLSTGPCACGLVGCVGSEKVWSCAISEVAVSAMPIPNVAARRPFTLHSLQA